MSRENFYKIGFILLLVINLGMAAVVLFSKQRHERGNKGLKQEVIKTLQFNDQQIEAYEVLITEHQKNIQQEERKIANFKKAFYRNNFDINNNIHYLDSITLSLKNIEIGHALHFKALGQLCSESQKKDFEQITQKLITHFNPKKRNKKHDK